MELQKIRVSILSICFVFIFTTLSSQDNPVAVVSQFTFDERNVSSTDADEVYRLVIQYINASGRITVVDRERWEELTKEREMQKREEFIDSDVIEQGRSLGAQLMFFGRVINIEGSATYATVELVAVDLETGAIIVSEVLSASGRTTGTASNVVDEVKDDKPSLASGIIGGLVKDRTKKTLSKNIEGFLDKHFPLRLYITRFIPKGNSIAEIWLYGQKKYAFRKGQMFNIVEEIVIDNPDGTQGIHKDPVASIKVKSVEGDYAICRVSKGGDVLFSKQASEDIIVQSK